MVEKVRGRLTYANVMSTLAVFLLLGGGAWAAKKIHSKDIAKNAILSKHIKRNQVKSSDIKNGKVKSADLKDHNIKGKDLKDGAVGSDQIAPLEEPRLVGAAGQPAFGNGGEGDCIWSNFDGAPLSYQPVSFFEDQLGFVHLGGVATAADGGGGDAMCDDEGDGEIFVLPPALRPERVRAFQGTSSLGVEVFVIGTSPVNAGAITFPAGGVLLGGTVVSDGTTVGLDGISFRAAGAGAAKAASAPEPSGHGAAAALREGIG